MAATIEITLAPGQRAALAARTMDAIGRVTTQDGDTLRVAPKDGEGSEDVCKLLRAFGFALAADAGRFSPRHYPDTGRANPDVPDGFLSEDYEDGPAD